jgi:hypothetical protein
VKVLFKNIPQQNDFVNALTEIVFERLLLKVKIRNIYS